MNIRAGLAFVALCAVWLTAPSFAAPRGSKIAAVEAAPNAAYVTAHYLTALAKLKHAKTVSFEYALEQLGLHTMEQTHRVYRSGSNERDETLVIDGIKLNAPAVRIITGRNPHYDIAVVTPRPETYRFTPVAAPKTSTGVYTYVFHVAPRAPRAFAVTAIELDGRTFLPLLVKFTTSASGARGTGMLRYSGVDGYWVVREAAISAMLPNGKTARERITWSRYRFPATLPRDTFRVPRPQASATVLPDALAVPGDAGAPVANPGTVDPARPITIPGPVAPK
jgi:hypothetical protein